MPDAPFDATLEAVSDETLARRIAFGGQGSTDAEQAELYRRFAPRVRLYGRRHLRSGAAADDLAQEVLLLTIERLRAGEVRRPEEIGSFILGTSRMPLGNRLARGRRTVRADLPRAVRAGRLEGRSRDRPGGPRHIQGSRIVRAARVESSELRAGVHERLPLTD